MEITGLSQVPSEHMNMQMFTIKRIIISIVSCKGLLSFQENLWLKQDIMDKEIAHIPVMGLGVASENDLHLCQGEKVSLHI